MEVPQKIKNGTASWLSIPLLGYVSEETQNTTSKEYMHPYVNSGVIYNSQDIVAGFY